MVAALIAALGVGAAGCDAPPEPLLLPLPDDFEVPWSATWEAEARVGVATAHARAELVVAEAALTGQAVADDQSRAIERERQRRERAVEAARARRDQGLEERIDVNTASSSTLQRLPRVGPATAARIIAARPFSSVEDLRRVRGIGPATLDGLRPWVRVGPRDK